MTVPGPEDEWAFRTSSSRQAYESWSRMLSGTHLDWSVTELDDGGPSGFGATVRRRYLGDVILVDCSCDPCAGVRRSSEIARTDGDYLVMLMTLQGSEVVAQNGRQSELGPGSVVVWDSETPAEFYVRTPLVKRSLLVPKPALAEVGARGSLLTGSVLDASAPAVTLLAGYLDALSATIDDLPLGAVPAARNATIELLAAALQSPSVPADGALATRAAAEAFVERRLRDPSLSPAVVAAGVGVSLRSLHRCFEDSADSVAGFIRRRRLARARDDLAAGQTVGQVARRWQFSDPSHFSRAFKRQFGVSPRDLVGADGPAVGL